METENHQLPIQLNQQLTDQIMTYCEIYSLDENDLIQDALNEFMQTRQAKVDHIINGYVEMAKLNSQIAEEFSNCESEAYAHIRSVDVS